MSGVPVSVTNEVKTRVTNAVNLNAVQETRITSALESILLQVTGIAAGPNGSVEQPIHIKADEDLVNAIREVASALKGIITPPNQQSLSFRGGGFVKVYVGDRPDEVVKFVKPLVVDSEGTAVDPQPDLSYQFSSSDEDIVSLTGEPTDNGDGTLDLPVHYGTPKKLADNSYAIAEFKAQSNEIETANGPLSDVKTEQIQLLPGSAAGFAGGGLGFPDPV